MKELDHPNVIKVIEIIENKILEEEIYLVMEYYNYPNLENYRVSLPNLIIPED